MQVRRIGLVTAAVAGLAALAAPTPAAAVDPCLASPSVQTCGDLIARSADKTPVNGQVDAVVYYAQNPDEIIICVRECGGTP